MTNQRFRSLSDPDSLRAFVNNLREGIYIIARDGRILDANPAFLAMLGVSTLAELQRFTSSDLFVDPARRLEEIALLERDGSVREFEAMLKRPDGEELTVLDTCYLIRDPGTGDAFVHGIVVDITARKQLEARLVDLSTHDPLTGALNRRCLDGIEAEFVADPHALFGCIFVDIDHFKLYNDGHGHQEGDDVLKRMARFLMRHTRAEECVVRLGGDEFVVLFRGADAAETRIIADRLRAEAPHVAPVPFSLGWAAREPGETLQQMLHRADQRLLAVRVNKRKTDPRMTAAE